MSPARGSLAVAAVLAAGFVFGQVSSKPPEPKPFTPGEPVEQPIPFSHKTHMGVGLKCLDCHAIKAPGDFAGFPAETRCMACHAAVKKDSPHIRKVAEARKSGTAIAWKRVYEVKEFVYFSHEVHHRKAGVDCGVCHGKVAERDVLFQEKPLDMYSCMKCHEQYKASNDCQLCHDAQ
ncbi:MAG: cytochrome c3 family protein [Bryobacterales bacterium]|nr:cytochrome c3 family protein [Bryobacterales bacterium]